MAEKLPLMRLVSRLSWLPALIAAVSLFAGCSNQEAELNEELRTEVMRVHDEVMINTGYIFELQEQLKQAGTDSSADDKQVEQLVGALEEARKAMFSWMHEYSKEAVDDDISIDNAYRKEQLESITEVGRITDAAISDAKQFLGI